MQSMNISLPEPLKEFVDRQIATGRYSSVAGQDAELTRADWSAIRTEALAHVKARKQPR